MGHREGQMGRKRGEEEESSNLARGGKNEGRKTREGIREVEMEEREKMRDSPTLGWDKRERKIPTPK